MIEIRISPEDAAALRKAAAPRGLSGPDYARFLAQFPPPGTEQLRRRKGPQGEPFRL